MVASPAMSGDNFKADFGVTEEYFEQPGTSIEHNGYSRDLVLE